MKVLQGTAEPSREAGVTQPPEFPKVENFPPPPQHLGIDGAKMWSDLGVQLTSCGVLQVVDLYALEQLCNAWQQFRTKAKKDIEVTASENNALVALLQQFGLTPAGRRRLVSNITETPKGNRFAGHGKRPA